MRSPDSAPVPQPVRLREIAAWCGYDFANASFTTVVVTVVFSVYFTDVICAGRSDGDWLWGLAGFVSQAVVVLASPLLGSLADLKAWKKQGLFLSCLTCVLFTLLLSRMGPGDRLPALLCFICANIAFSLGENFNSSFLPELAPPEKIGRISGLGWGAGYVGGLLNLLLCFPLLRGGFTVANAPNLQKTSLLTALFFGIAAIPAFVFLRDRAKPQPIPPAAIVRAAFARTAATVRRIAAEPLLRTFFGAFFLYTCGVATVIAFAAIYAKREIGFDGQQLILFFLLLQVSASIGAVLFGFLQDRWGSIPTLRITLVIWIAAVLGAMAVHTPTSFYIVGNLAGLGIGSVQSASRAVVGLIAPADRHAEYFGFWGLFGKLAAGIGPLAYGGLSSFSGSPRIALLAPLGFFIAGLWIAGAVRLPKSTANAP